MHKNLEKNTYVNYFSSDNNIKIFTELLSTFRNGSAIDHVYYSRFYSDQSCIMLSTNTQWVENFLFHFDKFDNNTIFENKLQASSNTNSPVYAMWHYLREDKLLQFTHEHGVNLGFDIYIRQKGYIEVLAVTAKKGCDNFHDYCINNLSYLYKVLRHIREQFTNINDSYRFNLPTKLLIPNKRLCISCNGNEILFTDREFECVNYILKGYTTKGIAQKLYISPRTVESYLNGIKRKLDVTHKVDIINKLYRDKKLFDEF